MLEVAEIALAASTRGEVEITRTLLLVNEVTQVPLDTPAGGSNELADLGLLFDRVITATSHALVIIEHSAVGARSGVAHDGHALSPLLTVGLGHMKKVALQSLDAPARRVVERADLGSGSLHHKLTHGSRSTRLDRVQKVALQTLDASLLGEVELAHLHNGVLGARRVGAGRKVLDVKKVALILLYLCLIIADEVASSCVFGR